MLELEDCICRKSLRQRKTAIWIRESLLALGPTFIKIGQLFSTRSDLLAAEYTEVCAPTSACRLRPLQHIAFAFANSPRDCHDITCTALEQLHRQTCARWAYCAVLRV